MKQKWISLLVSMALAVFAMAAGAACYHQYIVQNRRKSREQIIIREQIKKPEGSSTERSR